MKPGRAYGIRHHGARLLGRPEKYLKRATSQDTFGVPTTLWSLAVDRHRRVTSKSQVGPVTVVYLAPEEPMTELAQVRKHWHLDPSVVFLNHGSFGACPRPILELQSELRRELEREPVQFFVHRLPDMLEEARARAARFLGARPENLVFVRNATEGVNAVLRSLSFEPGDEILVTDHGYNACTNVARYVAGRAGARVRVARVPFPLRDEDELVGSILEGMTPRTRLVLLDHVTSPTGLVFPLERLAGEIRGVDLLVDGAHGPGQLPLDLERLGELGVSYYTGNFHKWCCAPKGAAMLWVHPERQESLHPPVISHGYNSPRDRSRFLEEFDWVGTGDPTAWLCVPAALDFLESLLEGGWPAIRRHNRELALEGRRELARVLSAKLPCPDSMVGSLAALPLPAADKMPETPLYSDPLQARLFEEFGVEVPIPPWPQPPQRLIRISAFLYNRPKDYAVLSRALSGLL